MHASRRGFGKFLVIAALVAGLPATTSILGHDQLPGTAQQAPILLKGGDLYTVSQGVLRSTDLLFEGGTIRKIGTDLVVPSGAQVIDVSGHRVYPGLIAPQSQIGLTEVGAVRATNDQDEIGDITPEVAAHTAYNPDSEVIPTVRSHGVTTIQVAPRGALIRGRTFLVHLDGWTKEDAGLRLIDGMQIGWPSAAIRYEVGGRTPPVDRQKERQTEARRELRDAFEKARTYATARAADPDLPVDLRWEAMRGLFSGEIPAYVVANDYREIVEAVAFAEEMGLRMILVGGTEADLASDLLVQFEIPVILASATGTPYRDDDGYDRTYSLAARLHEAGVTFCLGHITWGAWDMRNLPLQAGQAVAFGLPPEQALRALTLSTAEILGIDATQGSLDVGKQATLFVSEGDVMDLLTQRVTLMFIDGRQVDLDNRHKMLYRKYGKKPAAP